jgi:ribose 5-phosphate isomerase A
MEAKRLAAEKAVTYLQNDMIVGLGTGSTTFWAIKKIGERVQEGLNIKAVASSEHSETLARQLNIPIVAFNEIRNIDVTIDGADEVDKNFNLIKGGGGALLREKILVYHSKQFIVVVDSSKLVVHLGKYPLPIEIVPFASNLTLSRLKTLGCESVIRKNDDKLFKTDNGNLIADCHFNKILDPQSLDQQLRSIPGVVETGLFHHNLVTIVIAAYGDGKVNVMTKVSG